MKKCPECKSSLYTEHKICPNCGLDLRNLSNEKKNEAKILEEKEKLLKINFKKNLKLTFWTPDFRAGTPRLKSEKVLNQFLFLG